MKRSIISIPIITTCMMAFFMMSSFSTSPSTALSKVQNFNSGAPLLITSSNTTTSDNVNYVGNVQLVGAINASGTYIG